MADLAVPAIRRLEEWSHGHKARSVSVTSPDGYGAGCWEVMIGHEHGMTYASEANFWTLPESAGGESAYREEAERQGCVFAVCPEDEDWAGLDATITAALDAFDRGVWGPKTPRLRPFVTPLRAKLDATTSAYIAAIRWVQHRNNRHHYDLRVGSVSIASATALMDRSLGHAVRVVCGDWSETAAWSMSAAMGAVTSRLGLPTVRVEEAP